ncbi:DUF4265 domain-containing protein [Streptomyces sp. NPDC003758]|uniref:DUF4265 domain-containing protein n=1 Tax=Streptomyces cynarae TaxID=2981134 RepID=A0ABY6E4S4_9ACTN|nr:DUF4265 domain-containing protein [Streptomyces cynarae]UXY20241.1 DUF4265 domain-containing protein [Streptomyces cynarae]
MTGGQHSTDEGDLIQVAFPLEQDEDGYPPVNEERLPVRKLTDTVGQIVRAPFFITGVSNGDMIAFSDPSEGVARFGELLSVRGHSTLRVIFFDESQERRLVDELQQLGCIVETGGIPDLIAVDVPPAVDYRRVRAVLSAGESAELWEYEEGCLSAEHRAQS